MKVVGGTYIESVVVPDWQEWAGSGLRAAAALSHRAGGAPTLVTAVDETSFEDVDMVRSALGVGWEDPRGWRDELIGFRYLTPISAPSVNGPNSTLMESIEADDETILAFGLIEDPGGMVKLHATTVVLDPQRPRDPEPLSLRGITASKVYVVANSGEIRGLGQSTDIRTASAAVLAKFEKVSGVITKRGAPGCLVTTHDANSSDIRHELVGAHPTTSVWPIGSGDVFSAGIAHAIDEGADLVEAARIGSAAAAHWCSTKVAAVPEALLRGDTSTLPRPVTPTNLRVYLAAPFFSIAERWLVETVKDELTSLGATVWSPFHEVGPGGDEVAQQDLDGMLNCDVVLALLDYSDPGTVFEVGWAVRHSLPVVGFSSVPNDEGAKMMAGSGVELHRDLSTACYRAAWVGMGLKARRGWME